MNMKIGGESVSRDPFTHTNLGYFNPD